MPKDYIVRFFLMAIFAAAAPTAEAQTTQGIISGRVVDSITGRPLGRASVNCNGLSSDLALLTLSDGSGYFVVPLLPPGFYHLRAAAPGYQAQEIFAAEVRVAGRLDFSFRLRPLNDVWEAGQYRSVLLPNSQDIVNFYGPDVDTSHSGNFDPPPASAGRLDTSISDVISPQLIGELPLQGRDVYTALVMEPGVTSDFATTRGIGVAVNGQRPSSSNFLLDGSENNNSLISGPLLTPPPEAIQEFRFSTSDFSAEYGRTGGFVVNAVTRSGGEKWHGIGYTDINRAGFNANDFQRNAGVSTGTTRLPFYENYYGVDVGGPAPGHKKWLYLNTGLDWLWSKGDQDSETLAFPSSGYIARMGASNPNGYGVRLLQQYAPPQGATTPDGMYSIATVTPTTTIHRFLGLQRIDVEPANRKNQLSVRLAGGLLSEPDFNWSPYRGFSTALDDRTAGIAGSLRTAASPHLTNELRASWNYDNLAFPQPHPEIPNLLTFDQPVTAQGQTVGGGVQLPSAGTLYGYQNRYQTSQIADNVTWVHGRHIFKFGGDWLFRSIGGYMGLFANGQLTFNNLTDFFQDDPSGLELGIDRLAYQNGRYETTDFNRLHHNRQFAFFAQDSLRAGPRLSVNFGVRYDNFGVPVNVGATKDDAVQFGAGPNIESRIADATLVPGTGNEALYAADHNNWAGRFGFSYALGSGEKTVLRGGYGIFYDRSFDNLWEDLALNNVTLDPGIFNGASFSYSRPLIQNLALTTPGGTNYDRLYMYQPAFRTPYVQSFFMGVQRQITHGITIEGNYSGALGRELIATDRINRQYSLPFTPADPAGYLNPNLPVIFYRGNQGDSNYDALTVKLSGSLRSATFRMAYTWSHSIDNQSEPLEGEYDNLSITNISPGSTNGVAAFAQQFASGLDRGNSDFDQRQNLVGMGFWQLPGLLRGWRISGLGAIRSGLPFTVYASEGTPLYNARANLIDPANWRANRAVQGGEILLNAAAFSIPAEGTLGNTGRNAFPGPGFFSVDASLSRTFHFKRLPESTRLTFRVDLFNILNHVNLDNPLPVALGPPGSNQYFGYTLFGRSTTNDGSPVLTPLQETARQIHLILRFEF